MMPEPITYRPATLHVRPGPGTHTLRRSRPGAKAGAEAAEGSFGPALV